jgi:hypothetical protein
LGDNVSAVLYFFKRAGVEKGLGVKSVLVPGRMHHGEPLYPLDAIHPMAWQWALSSYNSRTFVVPPALGIAHRVLNCYLYITPIPVVDPKEVERRVGYFMKRAGYYYQNWNKSLTSGRLTRRRLSRRWKASSSETCLSSKMRKLSSNTWLVEEQLHIV